MLISLLLGMNMKGFTLATLCHFLAVSLSVLENDISFQAKLLEKDEPFKRFGLFSKLWIYRDQEGWDFSQ